MLVWQYIPDVFGICPAMIKLLFSGWFVGSSDGRKLRQWSEVPTTRNSNNLESSLWWSYWTCLVFSMDDQRPTTVFKCTECQEFRRKSKVPTVGSFDTSNTLTRLQWFSNILRVGSSDVCRVFQRSEVLTFIGSSDASQIHCNLVTVGAV